MDNITIEFPTECPVCMDNNYEIFNSEPLLILVPCKHVICHKCYRKINKCPLCAEEIISYFNLFSNNMFNAKVRCRHRRCFKYNHYMTYGDYMRHLKETCMYESELCRCGEDIMRIDLDDHECPEDIIQCINRRCSMHTKRKFMHSHVIHCKYRYVTCDTCDHKIIEMEMQRHRLSCNKMNFKKDFTVFKDNSDSDSDDLSLSSSSNMVKCKNDRCNLQVKRKKIKQHERKYRRVICDTCHKKITKRELVTHRMVCPEQSESEEEESEEEESEDEALVILH